MKNINFDAVIAITWGLCTILEAMVQEWHKALLCLCLTIAYYRLYKGE